jgi:hypothetical protein
MREFGPGRPLVFNHIPKTAGTALQLALMQTLQPAKFVTGIDLALVGGYDDIDSVRPTARTAIFVTPDEMPADATMVSGHIGPGTTMARYPEGEHITLLRSPQVRILSQWLHGRSLSEFDLRHWGPAAEAFRIARLPVRQYLEHRMIAPNVDNTMTRFLVQPHPALRRTDFIDEALDDELFAAAVERLGSFSHVDVTENPAFMTRLGDWLGTELPQSRANERTSVPARRRPDLVVELDPATRELLERRCRIDVRLWRHVAAQVLPDADATQVLDAALQKSIERYTRMLSQPPGPLTKRQVVERVYDVAVKVDPRRRTRSRLRSGDR